MFSYVWEGIARPVASVAFGGMGSGPTASAFVLYQKQGRGRKKFLVPAYSFGGGGYPRRRGGGVRKKIRAKIFSRTQNLKFAQLYPTSLEGARRIFFKATIEVSADMGGIYVFVFQGTKTPGLFRLQCSTHPSILSVGPKVAFSEAQ